MDNQVSVLGLLRRDRDLVDAGQYVGIIEAISALKAEARSPETGTWLIMLFWKRRARQEVEPG